MSGITSKQIKEKWWRLQAKSIELNLPLTFTHAEFHNYLVSQGAFERELFVHLRHGADTVSIENLVIFDNVRDHSLYRRDTRTTVNNQKRPKGNAHEISNEEVTLENLARGKVRILDVREHYRTAYKKDSL